MSTLTTEQRKNLEEIRDQLDKSPHVDHGMLVVLVRDILNVMLTGNRAGKQQG
jgi:hypothetical protein